MAEKRYYWMRLQEGFFNSKRIKKLRRIAGGDTFTIIYLKMQLLALRGEGVLEYTGLENTFAEELALDLDEDADNVEVTINYLLSCGLMETSDEKEFFLPYCASNIGSEGSSTKRVREHRERKALLENEASVTQPLQCNDLALLCNGEIEKEKDIEIEKEKKPDKPAHAPEKQKFGQYGWVKLTEEEHKRLNKDLGPEELSRCITYIDESAQSNGNKNKWKDWNLVIRRCHREGWGKRPQAQNNAKGPVTRTSADDIGEMERRMVRRLKEKSHEAGY